MKRITILATAAVVTIGARQAYAVDHEGRISELVLSKNGDATIQYVEIVDLFGGETYPNTPYKLAFFDAAGASIGSTSLTLSGLHAKWYVATAAADTAFGTTRDDTLTVALPPNGQVCFQRSDGATNISCLTWGCITHFVQVGELRTAAPPDNMSASRQSDGTYQITTPTPNNTTNATGTPAVACATDPLDAPPVDAGVPKDAPGNPNTGDAGTTSGGGDGGCCEVDRRSGAAGASLLAAIVLVALRATSSSRRRRRP